MKISHADVAWLANDHGLGDLRCLTFVRGLDEAEALRRVSDHVESDCQTPWIAGDSQGSKPLIEDCEVFVGESPI